MGTTISDFTKDEKHMPKGNAVLTLDEAVV
jgi:hypothetical protein